MKVQAEVRVYPLKSPRLSGPVNLFCQVLRSRGLHVQTRSMSTLLAGESQVLFEALKEAFQMVAHQNKVVVDLTISNACPDTTEQERTETERMN